MIGAGKENIISLRDYPMLKKVITYLVLFSVICLAFAACGTSEQTPTVIPIPIYHIVQQEDESYLGVVRLKFRIQVDRPLTEIQLQQICENIIKTENLGLYNALTFLFYLPDTDTEGFYTAGKAIWAPNGNWKDAGQVSTGDYSKHSFLVEAGNALGNTPTPSDTGFPEKTRRQIFYDLVATQDSGVDAEKAYDVVAQKYGIPVDIVREIGIEGVLQGWPMP
jgi:hypothetical protein